MSGLRSRWRVNGGGYKSRGSSCVRACSNYLFSSRHYFPYFPRLSYYGASQRRSRYRPTAHWHCVGSVERATANARTRRPTRNAGLRRISVEFLRPTHHLSTSGPQALRTRSELLAARPSATILFASPLGALGALQNCFSFLLSLSLIPSSSHLSGPSASPFPCCQSRRALDADAATRDAPWPRRAPRRRRGTPVNERGGARGGGGARL